MNVPSGKIGRKDVLKIEDRELTQEELDRLALIAPNASVAIIRNYSVAEKRQIELGEELVNIARCTFWNCITQDPREPLPHKLRVVSKNPLEIRCSYCGRSQTIDQLAESII
jgi:aspartate carbamoyltransferase regulatory subunit